MIAIVSCVALIGFPRLEQSLHVLEQRQTASEVMARLRQVRARAILNDRPTAFAVGRDHRSFGASDGGAWSAPPGVELSSGGRAIAFFGDGSSRGGVVWVSAAGRSLGISVAPATGAIGKVGR